MTIPYSYMTNFQSQPVRTPVTWHDKNVKYAFACDCQQRHTYSKCVAVHLFHGYEVGLRSGGLGGGGGGGGGGVGVGRWEEGGGGVYAFLYICRCVCVCVFFFF